MPGKSKGDKEEKEGGSEEIIRSLEKRVDQIKNLGFKIGGLRKTIKALKKEYQKKDGKPEQIRKKLDARIEKDWGRWEKERLGYHINIGEKGIEVSEKRDLDAKPLKNQLKHFKKALESDDIKSARERADELGKVLYELFKDQNDVIIYEAMEAMNKGLNSFIDVAGEVGALREPKKYFKKVRNYASKGDLDNLIVYSNLLNNAAQKEISEEVAKDRFQEIKSEIERLFERIKRFREYGLEPEEYEKELRKLEKTMDPKHFNEVRTRVDHIDKSIARVEKEYFRKKGHVQLLEVSDSIREYGNLIDFGDAEEKTNRLREDETTISPKKFHEECESVLNSVKEALYTNFEPQVKERMESLDISLNSSPIDSGEDIEMIHELKGMAEESLVNGHITEAMEYLSLAENVIGNAEGEVGLKRIKERYVNLLDNYETLLEEDLEMEELKVLLDDLESMFLDEEVDKSGIGEMLTDAETAVEGMKIDLRKKKLDNVRVDVEGTMNTFPIPQDQTGMIMETISDLQSDVERVEGDEFDSRIESIKSDFDQVVSDYFRDSYEDWMENVKSSMSDLEREGVKENSLYEELQRAQDRIGNDDYLGGGMILREMKENIEGIKKEKETEEIEDLINSAEFLFEEAVRAGVDIEGGEERLKEIKEDLREGKFAEARELAKTFEYNVKSEWMDFKREHLRDDIDELRGYIEDNSEVGLEIEEVDQLLDDAENLFDNEEFDEVNQIIQKARDTITEERDQFYSEGAMKGISDIKEEMSAMEDMGINTMEVETLLIEAERLFMNEDYEEAYSMTLDIREKIKESTEDYLESTVPKSMKKTLQDITRLEVMGLDTGSARDLMDTASGKLKQGDLQGSLEAVENAKEITDEIYRSHISVTIPETLVDVKKEIDQVADEGVDLQEVEELLDDAEGLFLKEDYDEALNMIDRARNTFEERKNNHYKEQFTSQVESVEDMVNNASDMGLELELSKDNINMARDAYERGDYGASHKLLDKVMHYLENSMNDQKFNKRKETVMRNLEEVNTLIKITRGESIDVSREEEMLAVAREAIDNREIDKAEDILDGIKRGINDKRISRKRNLIESSIKTTRILLDNMMAMGIDVSYENSLMEELEEGLRRGDLDHCTEINRKLEESLEKNKAPFMLQKIQQDITRMQAKIAEAKRDGKDTSDLESVVREAMEQYQKGDIEQTQRILNRGRELIDAAEKMQVEEEYERVRNSLSMVIDEMMELGVPTEDEEQVMSDASDLLENGEVNEAVEWLETGIVGAEAKIKSFHANTAVGYMSQIDDYLKDLTSKGVDISDLEMLYEEGKRLHEAGEDRKSIEKFSSILDLGEEKRRIKEDKEISEEFTTWDKRYKDMKKLGMKPSKDLKNIKKELRKKINEEEIDPEQVEEVFSEFKETLKEEGNSYLKTLCKKHIAEASKRFKEVSKDKTVDNRIKEMIKGAGDLFREGKYEEADMNALTAVDLLEAVSREESEEVVREELSSVKQMLTRLKSMGSNVSTPEHLLSKVEVALEEGKIDSATKLIKSTRKAIKEIVKRNMRESSKETIEFAESLINYLIDNFTGISQKLAPAENRLQEAREMFSQKKYRAAQKMASEAQSLAEDVDLSNIKQFLFVFRSMQAEEALRDVSLRMKELSQKNIDLSKAKILYEEAKENFDKGENDKGREMITLTRILLSELDQQSLREKAFDELNGAHVNILSMKRKGANIQNVYKIYENAKNAFSLQEYKKTILLAKKASFQAKSIAPA